MRFILFVLSLMASCIAPASEPIVGMVERDASGYHLKIDKDQTCAKYKIEAKFQDVIAGLQKLSAGDTITATGILSHETCSAFIDSIDYVGLKKLLGHWYSRAGILTVHDFNSMSFYPISIKTFHNAAFYKAEDPIDYRYSVTPTEGKEWVVFLSDKKSTTFATIQFIRGSQGSAVMKIYDSDNGKVIRTMHMAKWGNL